jgi:CHAT domain-containing protein
MDLKSFAEMLINSDKESERKRIIKEIPKENFLEFANSLKDICWDAWSKEPTIAQKSAKSLQALTKIYPDKKIQAITTWVTAISELTKGKLESAISKINESEHLFLQINEEHSAAQTQVSKLYILALLGKYNEAIECGKSALTVFVKSGNEIESGKLEQNIGNIYWRREQHEKAETYYLSALKRFKKLKDIPLLAMTENGLASNYATLNNFKSAESFYTKALLHSHEAKLFVREAEIEVNIGKLAMFRGKFDKALKFLESSGQKYEGLKMPHQVAISELEIADAYLELNLIAEAFEIYGNVSNSFSKLKMQGEEARSRANFGRSAILLNDNKTARTQLAKAAKLYVAENNLVGASAVKLSESQLELAENKFEKALKLAIEAENLLDKTSNLRYKLISNVLQAECLRNLGNFATAKTLLEKTFDDATLQENGQIAQTSQISLGKLANAENNFSQAEKYFKKAVELIETLRSPLPAEEFRMAFLADKLFPYQELAKICLRENRIAEAFGYVQSSRSRSLAENLGFDPKVEFTDKISLKLQSELEDLREELNWFYSRLNRADEPQTESLQTEIQRCEREFAKVYRKLNASGENSLQNYNLFDSEKLQKQLGKDKLLLEFVGFDGEISAFVVTGSQIKFVANIAVESEIASLLEGLQFQFGALRYGAKNLGSFTIELKKRADIYLQKLYDKLLKPFENDLKKRSLIVVPFRSLHYVPFQALHNGNSYVVENREVSFAPSASVLQFCLSKPPRKVKNALLIGFADEKIPLVNSEIKIIGEIFKDNVSLTDKNANFANFKKNAANFDVLHIACHGQFRRDNPMFSSLRLSDGSITVRDVCAMKLSAEIVTLSACETGLNSIFAGDELLGLSRGFLSAGASSMLLSLWTVNDEATGELMQTFYTELKKGKSGAESLRTAQLEFIKRELHPYFWSPFILIGKP